MIINASDVICNSLRAGVVGISFSILEAFKSLTFCMSTKKCNKYTIIILNINCYSIYN